MYKKKKNAQSLSRTIVVDADLQEVFHRLYLQAVHLDYRCICADLLYQRSDFADVQHHAYFYHPVQLPIQLWVEARRNTAHASIIELDLKPLALPILLRRRAFKFWSQELDELEMAILYQDYFEPIRPKHSA